MSIRSLQEWFAIYPDCDDANAARECLSPLASRVVDYPSGRSWIVGHWKDDNCFVLHDVNFSLALFGNFEIDLEILKSLRGAIAPGSVASFVSGDFHLVYSAPTNELWARGALSGIRRLFFVTYQGADVAASNALVLAKAFGCQPSVNSVVAQLLYPKAPYPLGSLSAWSGIGVVPEDSIIKLAGRKKARVERWQPQTTEHLGAAEGAVELRRALRRSVRSYIGTHLEVTADLSGGLDSTAVAYLGATFRPNLLTYRVDSPEQLDDTRFANLAAQVLKNARHVIVSNEQSPLPFARLFDSVKLSLDEPFTGIPNYAKMANDAAHLTSFGTEMHLTGHGGDEVVLNSDAYVLSHFLSNPLRGWRALIEYKALRCWSWRSLIKQLAVGHDHSKWLHSVAARVGDLGDFERLATPLGESEPRLPYWATSASKHIASKLIESAADLAQPIARDPSTHMALERIRFSGRQNRLLLSLMAQEGLPMGVPFLTDEAVVACLAVKSGVKTHPHKYKPLLAAAMQGIVPDENLARTTKSDFSQQAFRGRRRHSDALLAIFDDSRLERLGLVNGSQLRKACLGTGPPVPIMALWRTVACEVWLRSLEH